MSRKKIEVKSTVVDRVVSYFNPVAGQRRFQARAQMALAGGYLGGKKGRKGLSGWVTKGADADSDILPDLPTLRERSRDMVRNAPIAAGAINTKVTNVVGTGLKLHSRIDATFLGLTEDQADEWQTNTEREFKLFTQHCDIERQLIFTAIQELTFRSVLESGDIFVSMPFVKRPETPYGLKLQLIEADRVCNKNNQRDTATLSGGVERSVGGAPLKYHALKGHPGNIYSKNNEWTELDVFNKDGRRNVLHIFRKIRVGQTRGVPDLAPVVEALKQLSDYTEAEIHAAVVSGLFTVFVTSESGEDMPEGVVSNGTGGASDKEMKLGTGAIVGLGEGEKIESANPGRPNAAFDPFVLAISRQIGAAIEIPVELLNKHFTSSYSAARAALLEAWKFFDSRRQWLATQLCQPVYEAFMYEAVALGRIRAPGFLKGDHAVRMAYLGAEWIGPARGHIQPLQEIKAEREAIELGSKDIALVTAETTGGDFESRHRQRAKEVRMRVAAGLEEPVNGGAPIGEIAPFDDDPDKVDQES